MTAKRGVRLGRLLVGGGIVSSAQLAEATALVGERSLTRVLDELGYASQQVIAQAVADALGVECVDLVNCDLDPSAAITLRVDHMKRHTVLPIRFEGDDLVLAMADPADVFAIDDVRMATKREVLPVAAVESDLIAAIERFAASQANVDDMMGGLEEASDHGGEEEDHAEEGEESTATRLLNHIVADAIRRGAGDIYIEPGEGDVRVRFRIDGVCQVVEVLPKKLHRQLISRLKITSGMDIAERRIPQDGRFGVTLDGKAVDFRVAVVPLVQGEFAVLRLLMRDSIMMSLSDLGFLEHNLKRFLEALARPHGAILVTGPTGSGKSTTLYAALNETADPKSNLITVEDPVEYRLAGLSQVQVNEKAQLTFASALRSILRQDPDKVMIGEIRDRETGTIAVEAALTGHLVLSTLHTNDAPSAITRLTEMGIEPFLSASALTLVIAQRLARRLCPDCKEAYQPDEEALARVGFPFEAGRVPQLYRARGCKKCGGVGYRGRLGIHEVMSMSDAIERLVVNHASADEIARQAISEGMLTLRDDGFAKVRLGLTSIEEVLRVVV
jgi:type IV pilus assembly protein PilB